MTMKPASEILFSIIVPVYNRPAEVDDLMKSLCAQTDKGFEAVIVEDGSTVDCRKQVEAASGNVRVKYFHKENEGRSIARNYGIVRADGDYYIFVDSDCILPPDYIAKLRKSLELNYVDCFGGPDAAHESFTDTQKAINYSMTSFITTGGIRGNRHSMEKFTPRTFNMGFSREVADKVGGFREMFSEDIDMSTRIRLAGFSISLYPDVKVYHKRRVDMKKFWHQVYVFGMSRITLQLLYPGSMKLVHWLPAVFVIGTAVLLIGSFLCKWLLIPLALLLIVIWLDALRTTRRLKIACLSVVASMVQLTGYGTGFIKEYVNKMILGKRRDEDVEREIRKGENEERI